MRFLLMCFLVLVWSCSARAERNFLNRVDNEIGKLYLDCFAAMAINHMPVDQTESMCECVVKDVVLNVDNYRLWFLLNNATKEELEDVGGLCRGCVIPDRLLARFKYQFDIEDVLMVLYKKGVGQCGDEFLLGGKARDYISSIIDDLFDNDWYIAEFDRPDVDVGSMKRDAKIKFDLIAWYNTLLKQFKNLDNEWKREFVGWVASTYYLFMSYYVVGNIDAIKSEIMKLKKRGMGEGSAFWDEQWIKPEYMPSGNEIWDEVKVLQGVAFVAALRIMSSKWDDLFDVADERVDRILFNK